jgi:hypothetical protein
VAQDMNLLDAVTERQDTVLPCCCIDQLVDQVCGELSLDRGRVRVARRCRLVDPLVRPLFAVSSRESNGRQVSLNSRMGATCGIQLQRGKQGQTQDSNSPIVPEII